MTLKDLCSEVHYFISHHSFGYGYVVVWKNNVSWNWFPIFEDKWEYLDNEDERYNDGFDIKIKDKEVMKLMENAVNSDNKAVIIWGDELFDCVNCDSVMEYITQTYDKESHNLKDFYEVCCMDEYI